MADKCFHFSAMAKDKIVIQSPTETTDSYGGRTVEWGTSGTYWAIIEPLSGRELYTQQTTQSRVTHKMLIRYVPAYKNIANISDYRIFFDDRYFAINSIRNLGSDMKRHGTDYQELLVEENAPDIQG